MIYEIFKVETLPKKDGGEYKKMILQGEGQQNTEERVTLWSNHPDYAGAVAGAKFDWTMLKEDSGVPIPAHPGKNYINRSILMPGETAPAQPNKAGVSGNPSVLEMAIKTHIDQKFSALQGDLKIIADHLRMDVPESEPETPTVDIDDDINPEDIPF